MNIKNNTANSVSQNNTELNNDAKNGHQRYPFGKINFICMGICIVLIILGFILMGGDGSSVNNGFNPDIFSTRRIVIGPTISFLGFLLMAFAIIIRPKSKEQITDNPEQLNAESASENQ